MANPGKTTNHQALNCSLPAFRSEPQVTVVGGTPTPRKDNADSIRMAEATPNAIATNAGAKALGNACLNIIRNSFKPIDFAAWMYSKLLMRKNSALVNLAIPVHAVKPIITIKLIIDFSFAIAEMEIIKINKGMEIKISINLETIESTGIKTRVLKNEILPICFPKR